MCGFCTPGFLMSSKALLDKNKRPTLEDVKNACAGNLCRCGTYPRIFEAVLDASRKV
jgi:aerobic-type carbon monoxide dehydrogenase small subunit (CoxS/CutS family)